MTTIQYSPFTSIFENKAATSIIVGQPGSGKTFFILNICANALMMEQRVYAIDPKDDLGVLEDIFPDKIEYIDINNIKHGALNPFKVIKTVDTNLIASIVSIMCGGLTDSQSISVTPIINDFVIRHNRRPGSVSFSDLADYLYANDNLDAQAIGTKLNIHKDSKYGHLIFGQSNDSLSLTTQSKIISLHGMELPTASDENMTEEKKFNSGIVFIICKMLRELLTEGGYPTLFVMDEAHIAFQNPSFSQIINEFMTLGRSLNVPTLLASQSVSHYPEGIAQLTSNKFCFKSSTGDASKFLNLFYSRESGDTADFEGIIDQIAQFKTGDCFMIDSNQRSGIFRVTSLFGQDVTSNPLMRKRKKKR